MKKIKLFMILIPLVFIVTGCEKKEIEQSSNEKKISTPLLFEVTKEGSNNKLYLFGSMHACKEDLYPLPDYILNAYKNSDAIAVEFDLVAYNKDLKKQLELTKSMMYTDGKSVHDDIDDETYELVKKALSNSSLYNEFYDVYKPVMWFSLIENSQILDAKLDSSLGVDLYIINKAYDDNKEIIELESADYQISVLNGFGKELLLTLIKESVNEYDKGVETLKELYDNYYKGNKDNLIDILFSETEEDDEIDKEYNEKLLYNRNIAMAEQLYTYFDNGKNVFCTVGLAHIIGENSIIELLEMNGYTVNIVK